jgi:hypothetical protein
MTRNHETPPLQDDRYAHAATAKRLGTIMSHAKTRPLIWAQEIHNQWSVGSMRPRKDTDAKNETKLRGSVSPEMIQQALRSTVRGENELRLRSLMRATRLLSGSASASDQKMGKDLSTFLADVWGIQHAADVVAEGDTDDVRELREKWGTAQLPPAGELTNSWVADELLISAVVRRLK